MIWKVAYFVFLLLGAEAAHVSEIITACSESTTMHSVFRKVYKNARA